MGPSAQVELCQLRDATLDPIPADLPEREVHLWQRPLPADDAEDSCWELLSEQERERALRYRAPHARSAFIVTRSTLRSLIASYTGRDPQDLCFQFSEYGKPRLSDVGDLRFNVSHTEGLTLLAFARNREIGIDVEKIHALDDVMRVAERFFSPHEVSDLKQRSGDELQAAFFRCWTRKEAYIKARGEGLSLPLHQFDVTLNANERDCLLETRPDPQEANLWVVCDVPIGIGYVAAVAVGRQGAHIAFRGKP